MKVVEYKGTKYDYYQVKDGENLITIMQKFNLPAGSIIRNNQNIDFYEGEVVKLVYQTNQTHIVKPMENLANIAQKYDTTVDRLIELNDLRTTRLFIGQSLVVKQ